MSNQPYSKLHSQFARIESYGLRKSSGSKKTTVRGVCGEVMRVEGFYQHLEREALQPNLIFGMNPYTELLPKIEDRFEELQEKQRELEKQALRKDRLLLCGGVFSYPHEEPDASFENWINDCVEFLKKKYGEKFKSAVLHMDEGHPHIHFYLCDLTSLQVDFGLDPAKTAQYNHRILKQNNGFSQVEAYKQWQDDFYNGVSKNYNHRRLLGVTNGRIHGNSTEVKRRLELGEKAQEQLIIAEDLLQEAKELNYKANKIIEVAKSGVSDQKLKQAIEDLDFPIFSRTNEKIKAVVEQKITPIYQRVLKENKVLRTAELDYYKARKRLEENEARIQMEAKMAMKEAIDLKEEAEKIRDETNKKIIKYQKLVIDLKEKAEKMIKENATLKEKNKSLERAMDKGLQRD